MFMKKTILTFRWFLASLIVGPVILGILMISGLYVPPDTEVTSVIMQCKVVCTGLAIWIFLTGIPLVALVLAIREVTTGKRWRKDFVQD